jgi:hypothetical protein
MEDLFNRSLEENDYLLSVPVLTVPKTENTSTQQLHTKTSPFPTQVSKTYIENNRDVGEYTGY